ncbi:MAG: ABC transporter ATP-binding protein/permease, partial [Acidimicrobiia bacterium]|nr:ABC transporter ATP-binding protein/permease [Acidimicrobiia bacterium]
MEGEVGIDQTRPSMTAGARVVAMLVRPHMGPFITSVVGAAVFAGGTVVAASVLGWVTDSVVIQAFTDDAEGVSLAESVWKAAALVLAVAILRAAGVVSRRYFAGMTSERVERWTRSHLSRQYLHQPMSWLRRVSTGRLIAHVDADNRVLVDVLHPLPFAFGVVFLVAFSAISLIRIDPLVALIALAAFPAMIVINSVYSRIIEKPLASVQEAVAQLTGTAHASFEGALIVKTLGRRPQEVARFDVEADRLRERRVHVGYIRAIVELFIQSVPVLATLAVVIFGAYRVEAGVMSAGDIVTVAALFSALAIPMHVFGFLLESLIPSVVAWNRLRPVVEAPLAPPPSRADLDVSGSIGIDVRDLTFAWPDRPDEPVLRNINLSVAPGEVVAIVGPTGAGKSTLSAALAGVLDDAADAVFVGDQSLASMHPEVRTTAIGYAFQEAFLFATSLASNIDLDGGHTRPEVEAAAKAAAIHDWVMTLPAGYDTVVGERGVTVSGGQRQRIALARALLRRANVVILDDATSAVDSVVEERILSQLREAANSTMVIVANRLATIERVDRVVHLVDGRIAAIGTHEELLRQS